MFWLPLLDDWKAIYGIQPVINLCKLFPKWKKTGKAFPYSLLSVGPGVDPDVQAVSPQVTISHPSSSRLPLLSARPAVTFPAAEHHRPLAGTKLYCLVTEADRFEQLAQSCYAALPQVGFEATTCWSQVQCSTRCATVPPLRELTLKNSGQWLYKKLNCCTWTTQHTMSEVSTTAAQLYKKITS